MSRWVRAGHRWLSMAFTAVLACFAGIALGEPPGWLFYTPLPPLLLLMLSGVWLFVLPYARRRA